MNIPLFSLFAATLLPATSSTALSLLPWMGQRTEQRVEPEAAWLAEHLAANVLEPLMSSRPEAQAAVDEMSESIRLYAHAFARASRLGDRQGDASGSAFGPAIAHLADWQEGLMVLPESSVRIWDAALAEAWRSLEKGAPENLAAARAFAVTWNPSLLVIDLLQHTGRSDLVDVARAHPAFVHAALLPYPVERYGAAWLLQIDDLRLRQVRGQQALLNLIDAIAHPHRLGLGLDPLISHGAALPGGHQSLAGIVQTLCQEDGNDALGFLLLDAGLASIAFHHQGTSDGVSHTTSLEVIPEGSFFGEDLSDLIGVGGEFRQLCSGQQSGLSPSLGKHLSCEMRNYLALLEPPPAQQVVECFTTNRASWNPYMPEAVQVDWLRLQGCGFIDGSDTEPQAESDARNFLDTIVDELTQAVRDHAPGRETETKENVQAALMQATSTTDVFLQDQHTLAAGAASVYPGTTGVGGYLLPKSGGGYDVFVSDALGDPWTGAGRDVATAATIAHELLHATLMDLGISDGGVHHDIIDQVLGDKWQPGRKRPLPTEPGSGGCESSLAARRSRLIFDCLFGASEPRLGPTAGPPPVIYPHEPGGPDISCSSLSDARVWSSSGGGATDPSPVDFLGTGPALPRTFIAVIHGVIDPPKARPTSRHIPDSAEQVLQALAAAVWRDNPALGRALVRLSDDESGPGHVSPFPSSVRSSDVPRLAPYYAAVWASEGSFRPEQAVLLREWAGHEEVIVRRAAIAAIVRSPEIQATAILSGAISDPDPITRWQAVEGMLRRGGPSDLEPVLELLAVSPPGEASVLAALLSSHGLDHLVESTRDMLDEEQKREVDVVLRRSGHRAIERVKQD